MDRENNRSAGKNLWEANGRRGGLTESEHISTRGRMRSKSRYAQGTDTERSKSRYAQGSDTEKSGSRYAQTEQGRGGSRYADKRTAASLEEEPGKRRREKPGKTGGKLDPLQIALVSLGGVMVVAYIIVAVYFGGHFYSGAQIYGIDCSKKTSGQVKADVREKIGEYELTIEERNGQKDVITASQISLEYVDDSGIDQQMKKQRCYLWPAMMLLRKSGDLTINTTYDRAGIDQVLGRMNCFLPGNIVAPQDAYRGDTAEGYEVVPEVMGTTLDYEKTKTAIMDALDRGAVSVSLDEAGCYIDPVVYQDDEELNAEVEELNSLMTARITYDFDDRQEVVDASVIKGWIEKDENGAYYIDEDHIREYVSELAMKYDTFGCTRTFYTSIGTAVELTGGDYGWAMNQDATAKILIAAVKEGKTETIEPEYIYTAMSRAENDIGGTYVEICLSRQEMWCYQDGYLMVDTPVVTGNPNKGNATPSGSVWAIDAKMQDYVLRGEGYEAPVDYWMPFEGDVGIHDMQNRAYFGGSIYLSNGSHGCVNTPYDAAQTIYNIVSIGSPVIVYE